MVVDATLSPRQVAWLTSTLTTLLESVDTPSYQLMPLAGDASDRRYSVVVAGDARWVLVIAQHECNIRFVYVTHELDRQGIRVPYIFAMQARPEKIAGEAISCVLMSFVGDVHLVSKLIASGGDLDVLRALYASAIDPIHQWQTITTDIRSYDVAAFAAESDLFCQWWIPHIAQQGDKLLALYKQMMMELYPLLLAQPFSFAHRDYHSRNILIKQADGLLYTIDYQDAIRAPIAYDLVSLLKDCYYDIGDALRRVLCKDFYDRRFTVMQKASYPLDAFIADFEMIGIQRHLKVAGIFVRLCVRDGKSAYLDALPLCITYLQKACAGLPFGRAFAATLADELLTMPMAIERLRMSAS